MESYYGISESHITYIHGKAVNSDEIILGHGVDPNNFRAAPPKPPAGLSDEELERWEEEMNDQYDYSFELGKTALQDYFSSSYKDTQTVICDHMEFFESIENIEQVFILGHSLSDVDLLYFEKVIASIKRPPNSLYHTFEMKSVYLILKPCVVSAFKKAESA
ncbi:bacteriophage abortive infection AbiH family protein [Vibrio gazogenes]|nr:AbiH family protein [Vibrio gazogenes]USP15242.1 bacteriophage abortive infection AbiH family protein [Vibrio gazogenes]